MTNPDDGDRLSLFPSAEEDLVEGDLRISPEGLGVILIECAQVFVRRLQGTD